MTDDEEQLESMAGDEESWSPLTAVGAREHAALIGLLAERNELMVRGLLYVAHGVPPEDTARMLHVDSGIMWIAMVQRLAGDVAAAEDALRAAIWTHMKAHNVEMEGRGSADIDLEVPGMMLDLWRQNPNDWMTHLVSASCGYLHYPVKAGDLDDSRMVAGIAGDMWRLYAGTLSVLGKPTSRRWFGDRID